MRNYENRIKKLEEALAPVLAPALSHQERRAEILKIFRPIIERVKDPDERRRFRVDLQTDLDDVTDKAAEEFCNAVHHARQLSKRHAGGEM